MKAEIKRIFDENIELLAKIDRALIYFREGQLDLALMTVADIGDGINVMADAIMGDRDYFSVVSADSVTEMLEGILEAKRNNDYVLLADLFEVQLGSFICSIQELIMQQEDYFAFSEEEYFECLHKMDRKLADSLVDICGFSEEDDEKERLRVNHSASLNDALDPAGLLEEGYAVELTSCGLMTVAAKSYDDKRLYLHTNGHVAAESFLLAKKWLCDGASKYIVYGLGMGYHIAELKRLAPSAEIVVFESDMNIIRLFCAFSGNGQLLDLNGVKFVYDPEFLFLDRTLSMFTGKEKFCIHYPSFRRIKNENARELLSMYIPWYRAMKVE